MRGFYLFVSGVLVTLVAQFAIAQSQNRGVVRMNHVGISSPNLEETLSYYTETLGFPEAFRVTNDEGDITVVYVQVSSNSFLELQPSNEERPPGLSHFGIVVEDMDNAIEMWRERGLEVENSRISGTNAVLSNIYDANGIRMELLELPAGSAHAQATARWRSQSAAAWR
jgi:4-hydroxyphenylpyruvate dioxygenase-like putative hemolysin